MSRVSVQHHGSASGADASLRVATYNIHKGVRGLGLRKRLEIHNLAHGIESLGADLVFLQEVRLFHQGDARRFGQTERGWPAQGQAEYLAPPGFHAAYRTNAITRGGEHGNALLSRWPVQTVGHRDVSDHRFEQRGLLHVVVDWQGTPLHTVVAHLGLIHASRVRQVQRLAEFLQAEIPAGEPVVVAGDFNDWGERLDATVAEHCALRRALPPGAGPEQRLTFPSRVPVFALDRVYVRGLSCTASHVPRGPAWARMSDHLPLVVELHRDRGA